MRLGREVEHVTRRGRASSGCCKIGMAPARARVGAEIDDAIDGAALWRIQERGTQ